jgi:hypothetical protein
VDRGGDYDFSYVEPLVAAAVRERIVPIWDLCHYGYPDGCEPVASGLRRPVRALLRGVRGLPVPAAAGAALVHADQRDHVLGLRRRRMGLDGAARQRPRHAAAPARPAVRGGHRGA